MDRLLADETILRIFSYLNAADLAVVQQVSSHLRILAKDRHLWKRLFYFQFVQPGHASPLDDEKVTRSPILPTLRELRSLLLHQNLPSGKFVLGDGDRRISTLPRRFYDKSGSSRFAYGAGEEAEDALSSLLTVRGDLEDSSKDHLLDWEQLYRVSINWQGGKFAVSELLTPQHRENEALSATSGQQSRSSPQHTIVRVSNSFIFTAAPSQGRKERAGPSISVYPSESTPIGRSDVTAAYVPKNLHEKTPIACFSSPGLQRLMSEHPHHDLFGHVDVTEIAVDAATLATASPIDASNRRKRKVDKGGDLSADALARVMVAYTTGHFSLFTLHQPSDGGSGAIEVKEEIFHSPQAPTTGSHVVMAALHSPLLVLCSASFDISVYSVGISSSGNTQLNLVQRMSSYRCSWPASLRLKKLPYHGVSKRARRSSRSSSNERSRMSGEDESAFRVTLAYSTPSYPSSWSVSVQELVVRLSGDSSSTPPVRVTSRHATAKHPFRPTPIDLRGRSMLGSALQSSQTVASSAFTVDPAQTRSDEVGRSRTTSLTYDDPFVVVGASDNLLEVYELLGATTHIRRDLDPASTSMPRSATATPASQRDALRLIHRRSLHGHTGSVHSVALEDGRCVSGSADGSVMVWSLGDRSNETDSIASVMRNASRGGVGGRSTSSTILEEEEGEEAATNMMHVLTLRSPMELESGDASRSETRSSQARARLGPSLGQLVKNRVLDRQVRGVIRWVSTAFDKIVSIVAYTDPASGLEIMSRAADNAIYPRERVQVWSFG